MGYWSGSITTPPLSIARNFAGIVPSPDTERPDCPVPGENADAMVYTDSLMSYSGCRNCFGGLGLWMIGARMTEPDYA